MTLALRFLAISLSLCLSPAIAVEPGRTAQILGAGDCSTSGCHGGAGPNRGSHTIWVKQDPHSSAASTLSDAWSLRMAEVAGIDDPAESESCTICHAPMRHVNPAMLASPEIREESVSCANCHGPEKNWLLSHTRSDFPKEALSRLGMRQLSTPYERANNCVACHQNLDDALIDVHHPRLTFELDGLLVAEPKHWRETDGFSHAHTWLVGQAVALREAAAQALREPSKHRDAEIQAIRELLRAADTAWDDSRQDLVSAADDYAKRVSKRPMSHEQSRAILVRLINNRGAFRADGFSALAQGYYAERLALAIDRVNESLIVSDQKGVIADNLLNDLFAAVKTPESFEAAAFIEQLDLVAKSYMRAG